MHSTTTTTHPIGIPHADDIPFVDPDELRDRFAMAMSAMYREEVPLYGDLIRIMRSINNIVLQNKTDGKGVDKTATRVSSNRLTAERYGAIRLGTPYELRTVKRIFAILGMRSISYYDLSVANLPMHATCFRPTRV